MKINQTKEEKERISKLTKAGMDRYKEAMRLRDGEAPISKKLF